MHTTTYAKDNVEVQRRNKWTRYIQLPMQITIFESPKLNLFLYKEGLGNMRSKLIWHKGNEIGIRFYYKEIEI